MGQTCGCTTARKYSTLDTLWCLLDINRRRTISINIQNAGAEISRCLRAHPHRSQRAYRWLPLRCARLSSGTRDHRMPANEIVDDSCGRHRKERCHRQHFVARRREFPYRDCRRIIDMAFGADRHQMIRGRPVLPDAPMLEEASCCRSKATHENSATSGRREEALRHIERMARAAMFSTSIPGSRSAAGHGKRDQAAGIREVEESPHAWTPASTIASAIAGRP